MYNIYGNHLHCLFTIAEVIEKVYQSSHNKRAYDSFTKPQRKMISQWEEFTEVSLLCTRVYSSMYTKHVLCYRT